MKYLTLLIVLSMSQAWSQSSVSTEKPDRIKNDTEKHVEKFREEKVKFHTREDEQRMEHPNDHEYMEGKRKDAPKDNILMNPSP